MWRELALAGVIASTPLLNSCSVAAPTTHPLHYERDCSVGYFTSTGWTLIRALEASFPDTHKTLYNDNKAVFTGIRTNGSEKIIHAWWGGRAAHILPQIKSLPKPECNVVVVVNGIFKNETDDLSVSSAATAYNELRLMEELIELHHPDELLTITGFQTDRDSDVLFEANRQAVIEELMRRGPAVFADMTFLNIKGQSSYVHIANDKAPNKTRVIIIDPTEGLTRDVSGNVISGSLETDKTHLTPPFARRLDERIEVLLPHRLTR